MSRAGWLLVVLVLLLGVVGLYAYYNVRRVAPAPQYASAEEQFFYGSIGNEDTRGVPYLIWLVLPRLFPEYLPGPGGYASIGLVARDGHDMPIGLSKVQIGVQRVGVNCAMCHTATVRASASELPRVFAGGPAHQVGAQEYERFLVAAASDPRFTADTILNEIARNVTLSLPERLLYRFVLIPDTRRALLQLGDEVSPRRPDWGRGRTDLVRRARFGLLSQPGDESSIGTADAGPLWHLERRAADGYFWDRSNTSLPEVVRSSALFAGASPRWMDTDTVMSERSQPLQPSSLKQVTDYLRDLQPPKYPFAVDQSLAAAGERTYASECASCHEPGGARAGTAIPLVEIETDRHRLDAWTAGTAEGLNGLGDGQHWRFSMFRKATDGYVAPPLDGVWLSAPYLHNGSVPTLSDLLEPPSGRPVRFWRGYDVYDQARVGFVSDDPEARRSGTLFDVSQPGNGNAGHTYGTTLPAAEKRALLEYLKTR